jgi:hypothetical protein
MAFVPEGQADRSLARSAWDNATPKRRPVGYGVIGAGVRADSFPLQSARVTRHKLIGWAAASQPLRPMFTRTVPGVEA